MLYIMFKIIHVNCIIVLNQLHILMMEVVNVIDMILNRLIDDGDRSNLRKMNMRYVLCGVYEWRMITRHVTNIVTIQFPS